MTLYEEVFPKNYQPQPIEFNLADALVVNVAAIGSPSGLITVIFVQDLIKNIVYKGNVANDVITWANNATGGTGTNAPPGTPPSITPGANALYISFTAQNVGAVTGNLTLTIVNAGTGATLAQQVFNTQPGVSSAVNFTGTMPPNPLTLNLSVTP